MSALETALVSGIPVGIGQAACCDVCGRQLLANAHVELLVTIVGSQIDVADTRGQCCSRGELADGTERPCWLVRGRLSPDVDFRGRSRLVVSGPRVIDRRP
ncbi:hypothetical protein ACLI4U_18930 (plasmid) [Natrialbaceae archaeon A-CW2]